MRTPYRTTQIAIARQEGPTRSPRRTLRGIIKWEDLRVHDVVVFLIQIDIRSTFRPQVRAPAAMGVGRRLLNTISPRAPWFQRESPVASAPRLTAMPIGLAICSWSSGSLLVTGLDAVQDGLGRRVELGAESEGNCEALAVPDIWCLDDGCQVSLLSGPQRLRSIDVRKFDL